METQTKFFIALDVHTKWTNYAVRSWQGDIVQEGRTATTYRDVKAALEPYYHSCIVGMEACTFFYPLREGFLEDKVRVKIANTSSIRKLVVKTDKLDARRLSDMLRLGSFPESYIPGKDVQELRDLVSTRHALLQERTAIQARIWDCIMRNGIHIPTRSMFSKKGHELVQGLITTPQCPIQLPTLLEHYTNTTTLLEHTTTQTIENAQKKFSNEWTALQHIPGIGPLLATYLIAQVHPITRFANKKKLRRYAGVIPCTQESGGTLYGSHIPKSSSRPLLRWALTQAAHGAIRTKNSPLRQYYLHKKNNHKGTAVMAVARAISDLVHETLTKA